MLNTIIGNIDWQGAFVAIAILVCATVAFAAWINRNPPGLRERKQIDDHEEAMAKIESAEVVALGKKNSLVPRRGGGDDDGELG